VSPPDQFSLSPDTYLWKIASAIALWVGGGWAIRIIVGACRRSLLRGGMQAGLVSYIISVLSTSMRVFLLLAILGVFGIQTTSFAALIAGAGLAVGAAASGLLSNFAAGAFLQGLRPFKVGDYVIAASVEGTVEGIGMLVTTIVTPDHVHTFVPNGKLLADTLKNYSSNDYRRVELEANLEEGDDVVKAIELLQSALLVVPNQAPGKPPVVDLFEFKKKGPRLAVWLYTHTNHYWQVYFDANRVISNVLLRHNLKPSSVTDESQSSVLPAS
jgi:small conductance mechanosensitive channel